MPDLFKDHAISLTSPASFGAAVSPSDSAELSTHARAIYLGGAGDLAVELTDQPGQALVLANLQAGIVYPFRVSKVLATGTSATGIVALW